MTSVKRNFIYISSYKVLELILPLVTSPILSRRLGAEGLGVFSYSYAIVSVFVMVAELGLYRYGMREIARVCDNKAILNKTFSDIFTTHIVNGILILCIYIILLPFICGENFIIFFIQSIYILSNIIDNAFLYVGIGMMKPLTLRDTTVKLSTFILIIIAIKTPSDLIAYALIMSLSSIFARILSLIYGRKFVSFVKPSVKSCLLHYKNMFKLMIPLVSEGVYNNLGKLMVGAFFNARSVGYLDLSSKATIPKTIISSVGTVMCPNIAKLYAKGDKAKAILQFEKSFRVCMIIAYLASFGIASVASEFAPWFWGEEYIVCAPLIMGFAASIPFWAVGEAIRNQFLLPTRRDNQYLMAFLIGVFSLMLLCCCFVPKFGAMGAVISTIGAEAIMSFVQIILVKNDLSIFRPILCTIPYLITSLLMFLCVRIYSKICSADLSLKLFTEILVGILAYFFLTASYELLSKKYLLISMFYKLVARK